MEYSEFIKKFTRPDQLTKRKVKNRFIGCTEVRDEITKRVDFLLESNYSEQDFALITGPPGTGKTTFVRDLANSRRKLNFIYLRTSWMLAKRFGDPEAQLIQLFDEAIENAPTLILIDKLDLICASKRGQNDARDRVFNILAERFECLNELEARVLVLAATDSPEKLDPQIRKGFFDDELRFSLPTRQERIEMLNEILTKFKKKVSIEEITQLAEATHCFSYRDLKKLCKMAARECKNSFLTHDLLQKALTVFKPFTIKSLTTPCPPLRWIDIGGSEGVKQTLCESVIWPLEQRERFQKFCVTANKGALLYGPPGCSKTMLAQALATESGHNFISVKGPELFSKWVGDSEAAVRRLYRNAREIAPCIIFFDEIDGLAPERSDNQSSSVGDKVVAQLLVELNGIEPLDNVFTIAATNRPDRVDSALMRPGRLDPAIYIPLPSESDRAEIFKVHLRSLPLDFGEKPTDVAVTELAQRTRGYSGAEIAKVCQFAGILALRDITNEHIDWSHFESALETVKPQTRIEHLKSFAKFQERSLQIGQRTSLAGPLNQVCDDFNRIL